MAWISKYILRCYDLIVIFVRLLLKVVHGWVIVFNKLISGMTDNKIFYMQIAI